MAKRRNPKSKDFATKQTLNPPGRRPETGSPRAPQNTTVNRDVGQFTGEGVPSLQKK